MEFHKTRMGADFYQRNIPHIAEKLTTLANEQIKANKLKEQEIELKKKELEIRKEELELKQKLFQKEYSV